MRRTILRDFAHRLTGQDGPLLVVGKGAQRRPNVPLSFRAPLPTLQGFELMSANQLPPSLPGLSRQSIFFAKGWMRGSSPRMTEEEWSGAAL
jgi:hypothetical protein